MNAKELRERIAEFAALEPGWDSYKGQVSDPKCREAGLLFVDKLEEWAPGVWHRCHVSPASCGGVCFEWFGGTTEDRELIVYFSTLDWSALAVKDKGQGVGAAGGVAVDAVERDFKFSSIDELRGYYEWLIGRRPDLP